MNDIFDDDLTIELKISVTIKIFFMFNFGNPGSTRLRTHPKEKKDLN